jgi:tRNA A37 threonylcarbamoyladenosine modification protein TsaB
LRILKLILLIDSTSSKVKLVFNNKTVEYETDKQALNLPRFVHDLLAGEKPDAVGVVVGPGSFTGIRLAIAFAKGLAMGYGIPVIGISLFDLFNDKILAVDSKRDDYFVFENGEYRIEKDLPSGAHLIQEYDLTRGIDIVKSRLDSDNKESVIPLYIRSSYVEPQQN